MDLRHRLKNNITDESIAYGYTLAVWGSGATVLTNFEAITSNEIFAFIFGGLVGFGVIAGLIYTSLTESVEGASNELTVVSMFHIFASLGTVIISNYLSLYLVNYLSQVETAFLIGVHVTVSYNLFLVIEELISDELKFIESKIQ